MLIICSTFAKIYKLKRAFVILILICSATVLARAQKAFDCGAAYLSVGQSTSTRIYKLEIRGNQVLPSLYTTVTGLNLNGFGFRRQDRMMYALSSDKNADLTTSIYRIDGAGNSKLLAKLPFDPSYNYISADVSPDGKYYTVLANGNSPAIFYVVDLQSPTLAYQTVVIRNTDISAPDIAYSVNGDKLFVEDDRTKSLLEIDLANAKVQAIYPSSYNGSLLFSGLFGFDCALFGYVRSSSSFIRIETMGKNLPVGTAQRLNSVNFSQTAGMDACSCPQTIKFEKTAVKINDKDTCSRDYRFVFSMDNECNTNQSNIDFSDRFPEDFTIRSVERQPFGGNLTIGAGGRDISIKSMNISSIKDSVVTIATLSGSYRDSTYKNQALLTNLTYPDGSLYSQVSDNPFTIRSNDSTIIKAPLYTRFGRDTVSICRTGEINLRPKASGVSVKYHWSTGATTAAIPVDKPGLYRVTVSSGCFSRIDSIAVIDRPLTVDIGPDHVVLPGDSVVFVPSLKNYNPIKTRVWSSTAETSLGCTNCISTVAFPKAAQNTVQLRIEDELGCIALDEASISIRRRIFIPDAFSPNDDGYNDYYFINTERDAKIVRFEIYNRWGDRVFEAGNNCKTNRQECGWDGKFKGFDQNPSTYTYRAVLDFGDGIFNEFKGDVLLIRN